MFPRLKKKTSFKVNLKRPKSIFFICLEHEFQIPNRGEFDFPPGPEYNVSVENVEITLNENDDLFRNNDLTFIDRIFEEEAGENIEEFLNEDMARINSSRAASEIRDDSRVEEARFSVGSDGMMLTEQDPNLARYESKINPHLENATRLRGSNSSFLQMEMEVEPFEVPPNVVGGFEPELGN